MSDLKYNKVVIWGYPLYSHTASYGWEAYNKAFKHLGYEVHWFHDDDFPEDFDFSNTMFLCEGFADKKLPLNDTSCYFVWYCPDPSKYINAGVKRFVDVRMPCNNHKDHIHDYTFKDLDTTQVGPSAWVEKTSNSKVTVKNDYVDYEIDDFTRLYINWASNLVPDEIKEEDIYLTRENKIYFLGNLSHEGVCENASVFGPVIRECARMQMDFVWNNPWKSPITTEQLIAITKRSLIGMELRGPEHVRTDMVPERIFKNISYGHLGMSNSKAVLNALDGNLIYNEDPVTLFHEVLAQRKNWDMAKAALLFVKENHTYVNRIKSLIKVANEEY